jgi:hypothetical protein
MFSRNAASSRAIPIDKMIELVEKNPATPLHWGLNKSGMQASEEHESPPKCEFTWAGISLTIVNAARSLQKLGLHKQIVNRVLEPFQMIKVVVTATEFDNFFWLRCHEDAQPEIKILADKMYKLYVENVPDELVGGEWHLPYIDTYRGPDGTPVYCVEGEGEISLEQAKKYSAACCAAVSYRTEDMTIEKAERIYKQLIESTPCHASPVEHQATPITNEKPVPIQFSSEGFIGFTEGVTHFDYDRVPWSGNFKWWIQNRQLIPNNVCKKFNSLTN